MRYDQPFSFQEQAEEFGREMAELLLATLPGMPDPPAEILSHEGRIIIGTPGEKALPLQVRGQKLAGLKVTLKCEMDSRGRWLAVEESTFSLLAALDRAPVLRMHYYRTPRGKPSAHLHVHGHRGALSHLLSQAGHPSLHEMSSLHIPVGGARFRPCLEDFIQFVIAECKFDARPEWQAAVDVGRERWRRRQAAVVAREMPEEAARVLAELGYTVTAPEPAPVASARALRTW